MSEIIDMASQFKGLPMGDLIGSPLTAACDAQIKLANATANFIKYIGFLPPAASDPNGVGATRTAHFAFTRPIADPTDATKTIEESVSLDVPLLAIAAWLWTPAPVAAVDHQGGYHLRHGSEIFFRVQGIDRRLGQDVGRHEIRLGHVQRHGARRRFGCDPQGKHPYLRQFRQIPCASPGRRQRHAGRPGTGAGYPAIVDPAEVERHQASHHSIKFNAISNK